MPVPQVVVRVNEINVYNVLAAYLAQSKCFVKINATVTDFSVVGFEGMDCGPSIKRSRIDLSVFTV